MEPVTCTSFDPMNNSGCKRFQIRSKNVFCEPNGVINFAANENRMVQERTCAENNKVHSHHTFSSMCRSESALTFAAIPIGALVHLIRWLRRT